MTKSWLHSVCCKIKNRWNFSRGTLFVYRVVLVVSELMYWKLPQQSVSHTQTDLYPALKISLNRLLHQQRKPEQSHLQTLLHQVIVSIELGMKHKTHFYHSIIFMISYACYGLCYHLQRCFKIAAVIWGLKRFSWMEHIEHQLGPRTLGLQYNWGFPLHFQNFCDIIRDLSLPANLEGNSSLT